MSQEDNSIEDAELTLDPPGAVAVVGAGPLGIEAALYGRFLGYDVTLLEAVAVGQSMIDQLDAPLPMLPDRCLSPLALGALQAQSDTSLDQTLPMTIGQWIDNALVPLSQSDLLRGRLRLLSRVTEIVPIAVQSDQAEEDTSDIPADFRLTFVDQAGRSDCIDAEAVILAVGTASDIRLGFDPPVPYFCRIGTQSSSAPELDFVTGLREIVSVFAGWAGRADLDLYRPRRS